jgi:hypothetical protein
LTAAFETDGVTGGEDAAGADERMRGKLVRMRSRRMMFPRNIGLRNRE